MELKIDDFKMVMHINYGTGGECQYKGIINAPEHILHGKPIWKIVYTPKSKSGNWGKGKCTFYVGDDKKGFKDVDKLIEHYGLPPLPKRAEAGN